MPVAKHWAIAAISRILTTRSALRSRCAKSSAVQVSSGAVFPMHCCSAAMSNMLTSVSSLMSSSASCAQSHGFSSGIITLFRVNVFPAVSAEATAASRAATMSTAHIFSMLYPLKAIFFHLLHLLLILLPLQELSPEGLEYTQAEEPLDAFSSAGCMPALHAGHDVHLVHIIPVFHSLAPPLPGLCWHAPENTGCSPARRSLPSAGHPPRRSPG